MKTAVATFPWDLTQKDEAFLIEKGIKSSQFLLFEPIGRVNSPSRCSRLSLYLACIFYGLFLADVAPCLSHAAAFEPALL